MAYCSNCGSKLEGRARFCSECGTPVAARDSHMSERSTRQTGGLADRPATGSAAGGHVLDQSTRPVGGPLPKKSKAPLVAIGVGATLLLVALLVFVVLQFIPRPHDPNEGQTLAPPEEVMPTETKPVEAKPSESKPTEEAKPTEAKPEAKPTEEPKPTEVKPVEESKPTEAKPTEAKPTDDGAKPEAVPSVPVAADFSTADTPVENEFSWYIPNRDAVGPGEGATLLTDFSSVQGGWKAYIYNEPVVEYASSIDQLLNVRIEGDEGASIVAIDWYWVRSIETGDTWEDTTPDSIYQGSWEGGTLTALGAGQVRFTCFWLEDGKEYALGTINWPDASHAQIALVRP